MGKPKSILLSLIRYANRKTRNSRVVRRVGIWGYSSMVRANIFLPAPRVLLNGPPKTGTHLLSDCLSMMPKMMFSGRHFALPEFFAPTSAPPARSPYLELAAPLEEARLRRFLDRCPQGMFVTAHAGFHPGFRDLVGDLRFRHVFLLRDPRDVAVSRAFYITQDTQHPWNAYFTRMLESDDERLMATIHGIGKGEGGEKFLPSIGQVGGVYLPWSDDPSTLVVRFEDLIGPRGGGEGAKQLDQIQRIGSFLDRPLDREQARQIAQKMYAKGSLTFRKGQAGDWRNHFTEAHKHAFKVTTGDLLVRLGYEEDTAW